VNGHQFGGEGFQHCFKPAEGEVRRRGDGMGSWAGMRRHFYKEGHVVGDSSTKFFNPRNPARQRDEKRA